MNIGHLNFFKVNKCGLYKVNDNNTYGLELSETFDLIQDWVGTKSLALTIPWDPKENPNRSKCYCKDIYKDENTGDFLIMLWKSDTDSTGSLLGASEDGEIGSSSVVKYTNSYRGKKVIWGRPCFYWVIPELETIVSIKFDHSICDSELFQDYVHSSITNRVKHSKRVKNKTEKGYIRLSNTDDDDLYKYMYRFDMKLRSLETTHTELGKLIPKITHIVRRETIIINPNDARADWLKTFSTLVPFVSGKKNTRTRQIEIKAEAKPSLNEVKEIIEKYSSEDREKRLWDNVGFATDKGITWVDKYRMRDILNVPSEDYSTYSAAYIYEQISHKRKEFISPILKESKALQSQSRINKASGED